MPTPDRLASNERIFLPPNHLARRGISFGSLGRAKLAPEELHRLMEVFANDKFLLVVGEDVKNQRMGWMNMNFIRNQIRYSYKGMDYVQALAEEMKQHAQENCHIVLHADATNRDIVKSSLALAILRRKLGETVPTVEELRGMDQEELENAVETYAKRRSRDCMDLVDLSRQRAHQLFGTFLKVLSLRGWATPARFMFGRVTMRAEWPIQRTGTNGGKGGTKIS